VLLAANLGEDADTVAAVAGQIAGALSGLAGIPQEWLARLAWREKLENTARLLTAAR
jgi:ADP-ribosyl-[dinitrogen reductase] hydrolase